MQRNTTKRQIVLAILHKSFKDNKSTNFVVKQDKKKDKRIKILLEYCYAKGEQQGTIYLSPDNNACAIVLYPEKEKTTLKGLYYMIKLLFGGIGLFRVGKITNREKTIQKHHPTYAFNHLWYIGVNPDQQGKGLGTQLMNRIMEDSKKLNRPLFLETSNEKNFPFYERLGFKRIAEMDNLGYPLKMYLKSP